MEAPLLLPPKASVSTERQTRDVRMTQLEEVSKRVPESLHGGHYLAHIHMSPSLLPHSIITDEPVRGGLRELNCVTYGLMDL